jgi:hypothetical protein
MHTALLANTAWLDEELAILKHLAVGLMDEQVRIAAVLPRELSDTDTALFVSQVVWKESRFPRLNQQHIAQLDDVLESMGVQIIHALDGRMWRGAIQLARRMNLPVVLGACSGLDVKLAAKLSSRINVAITAITATTEPIAEGLRQELSADMLIATIPPGIFKSNDSASPRQFGDALCAIISGNGVLDGSYQSLLEGIARVISQHPHAQFFFDGQDDDQHEIWKAANRLGLLANMSLAPRRLGHREVLLKADVLIQPQALGKSRSVTLQAMARGMPIIAQADPWLDYLLPYKTAWTVDDPDPAAWAQLLLQFIKQPQDGIELGQQAREWVNGERLASMQIAGIIDLYRRLTGQTIAFTG